MLDSHFFVQLCLAVALSAVLAAIFHAVSGRWKLTNAFTSPGTAFYLAAAGGLFFLTGWPGLPPHDVQSWLPYLALAGAILSVIDGFAVGERIRGIIPALMIGGASAYLL